MMAFSVAVAARDMTKRHRDLEAVRSISFDVPAETCFGFLGPNGAGKTTTMRMISCALPRPPAGSTGWIGKILRVGRVVERIDRAPEAPVEPLAGVRGSLQIRHVDAGSCNGCEVEISGAFGPVYDVERFGARLVASPRHADALLVTGVVTRNMADPLRRTVEATPRPRVVIACGDCALNRQVTRKRFMRDVAPETRCTRLGGTSKCAANNRVTASLALPSTARS
jgi:Ni,Fe-hydrogenase III small subunit